MQKRKKLLLLGIFVFLYILLGGCSQQSKVSYGIKIDENRYPGYQEAINKMEQSHPNWTFELLYTGLDWQTVIDNEYTRSWNSNSNKSCL